MRALVLFFFLLGLWLIWSGHYTGFLVGAGVVSCAAVVALCLRMRTVDSEGVPAHLIPGMVLYLPWLAREVFLANLDVVRRVLHPDLPIAPRVTVLDTTQKSDLGRVVYANSITLTPGTVTIEAEGGTITVHSIAAAGAESLEQGEMDRRVTRMEASMEDRA